MPTVNGAAVLVALMVMMPLAANPLTVNVSKVPVAGSEYVDVAVTPEKLQRRAHQWGSERPVLKDGKKELQNKEKKAHRRTRRAIAQNIHAAAYLMTNALVLSLTLVPACRG